MSRGAGMLIALLKKELRLALRARRVTWTGLSMLLLCTIAALFGGAQHAERQRLHQSLTKYGDQDFSRQEADHPHSIAHNGYVVARPPAPLGFLDGGVEDAYGRWIRLDAHLTRPLTGSRTSELSRGPGSGRFDLGLLLAVFAPALVILLGFDLIARERTRGTWAMMRSAGVRAGPIALSKWGGLLLRVGIALVAPATMLALISAAYFGALGMRALAWLAAHILALAVWCAITVLVSAIARNVRTALLLGVALWAVLALFVPPFAGGLAGALAPVPPPGEAMVKAAAWADSAHAQDEARRAAALRDIRRRHPDWDGTGDPPEVVDAVMLRLADAEASRKMFDLFSQMDEQADHQERIAAGIATASPTGLASLASSGLAGSDLAHLRAAFVHYEAYRVELMAWFNDWWAKQGRGGFDAYGEEKAFGAFDAAPRPSAPSLPLAFALSRAMVPVGLLILAGLSAMLLLLWVVGREMGGGE